MINVVIYLKRDQEPVRLVEKLLSMKFIANATIDENNESYTFDDNKMVKEIYSVITAKTLSTLFSKIEAYIESELGPNILINSVPIIASNKQFNKLIQSKIIQNKANENFTH